MHYYRLYYLDENDQHIVDVRDFRANSDALVIVKAGAPEGAGARELWNHGRKVLELVR